ncbi:MAG TPA: STAS domain-containing protein [Pseudolabrys sp.]|nr:STAS domain-containing protein [Pseudolabrys sp.]
MDIMEEQVGDMRVVVVSGRLDGAASTGFAEQVGSFVTGDKPKLLLDFGGVDFVTSAGLRAVLQIVKRVKASGGVFALCSVRDPVREVLDISGFTAMFSIHPGRSDAVAAMAG